MWMKLRKIVNFGRHYSYESFPLESTVFSLRVRLLNFISPQYINWNSLIHLQNLTDKNFAKVRLLLYWRQFLCYKAGKKAKRLSVLLLPSPWVHWRLGDKEVQGHHTTIEKQIKLIFLGYISCPHVLCFIYIWEPYECVWKKSIKGVWMFNIQQVIMERPSYKGNSPSGSGLSIA